MLEANSFLGSLQQGSFIVVNKNTDGKIIVANYIADEDKDGSQSDKDETHNHSEEEEEHKSTDNVSEAKDPDDYFDNGEGNKRCLEAQTSKDFKKKKTIDLYEYKATGNQVQIFKNSH